MQQDNSTDDLPDLVSLPDDELLSRFVEHDQPAAFRTLVERHGPLVLSVCRRSLTSLADADDAFQATFLVFAQSAGKIRRRESLAAWHYGVAMRVSIRMRRQGPREIPHVEEPTIEHNPLDELLARHDARVADEELAALPTKLRTPLVLRYLAGKTNAEVAEELGITIAALEGRLKRGKQRLRMRLIRRGVLLTTLVSTLKSTQISACDLPVELVEQTTELCTMVGGASLASAPTANNLVTHLAQEELVAMKSLMITKPVAVAAAIGTVVTLAVAMQMALAEGNQVADAGRIALQAETGAVESAEAEQALPVVRISRNKEANSQQPAPVLFDNTGDQIAMTDPPGAPAETVKKRFADNKPRSESEVRIEAVLTETSRLDFVETPLEQIVEFLRDEYQITILLDNTELDKFGLGPDEPVTIHVQGVSLESALRLMLRPIDLAFIVQDEVLLITTAEEAELRFENRIYPISPGSVNPELQVETIKRMIAPDMWESDRCEADIVLLGDRLVIRQTYANHAEINELLLQLKQAAMDD